MFFIQKQNYPRKLLDSFCQLLLKEKPAALQWRLATQIREQQHLNWGPSNELPGTSPSRHEGENWGDQKIFPQGYPPLECARHKKW